MSDSSPQPEPSPSRPTFFGELKRRKVFRVAGVYVVVAWLMLQAGEILFPAFDIPDWGLRMMAILALLGFPIAIVLAWAFEVTPDGVKVTRPLEGNSPSQNTAAPGLGKKKLVAVFLLGAGIPSVGFLTLLGILLLRTPGADPGAAEPTLDIEAADRQENSIAVLPFENLSVDEENEYFARGIHEDILMHLSSIEGLKVISRTSVMQYGSGGNIRDIARELGVNYVLEGSVRRSGDEVRVNAQLIEAETDKQILPFFFDSTLENVFLLQSQIAQDIVKELTGTLAPETMARLTRRPTENLAAYDLFIRARDISNSREGQVANYEAALTLLRTATEMDPSFAEAWAEQTKIHSAMVWFGLDQSPQRVALAETALEKAKEIAPELPATQAAEGIFQYHGKSNFGRALMILNRALESASNDPELVFYKAMILRRFGQMEDAIAINQEAIELDPLNISYLNNLTSSLVLVGRWEEARQTLARILELDPQNFNALRQLSAMNIEQMGTVDPVLDELLATPLDQRHPFLYFQVADYAALSNRMDEAIAFLKEGPEDLGFPGALFIKNLQIGNLYLELGNDTLSAQYFEKGVSQYDFLKKNRPDLLPEELWNTIYGYIALYSGDALEGESSFRKNLELFPIDDDFIRGLEAMEELAFFYLEANLPEKAKATFSEIFQKTGTTFGYWFRVYNRPRFREVVQTPEFAAWAEQVRPDYVYNWLDE